MVRVSGLTMSFGSEVLFDGIGFTIGRGERIGLVGRNGSGKTTLFNILSGRLHFDEGTISFPRDYRIGYAEQHLRFTQGTALAEVCLGLEPERRGESWQAEKVLAGLGFTEEDMGRSPGELSGGFQVRLNLARILVQTSNLLLLDEPTNYLDIVAIRWLARFLKTWPGELMLITHDRGFMDSVVTHTMVIHRKKVRKMSGGTDKLYEQIIKEEEIYEKTRQNDEKRMKEIEVFINRFRAKARLANLVQSRIKTLQKRVKLEKLEKIPTLEFSFTEAPFPASTLLEVRDLAFTYDPDQAPLIDGLCLTVGRSDRIGVIGKNGKGKTTLLRLLYGELTPSRGGILTHQELTAGYFGQTNIDRLYPGNTIEEEILQVNPDAGRKRVMDICGAMMFGGDAAQKRIEVLSGGEKSRVLLGKILASPANLLLLDEPSNHLDMESSDSLMAAIDSFGGAVVVVTHNETILNSLVERLVVFGDDGITVFEGGYQEFLEKGGWGDLPDKGLSAAKTGIPKRETVKKETQLQKELRKARAQLIADRSRALRPIEEKIGELEASLDELETKSSEINRMMIEASERGDGRAIQGLAIERHTLQERIDSFYAELDEVLALHEETALSYQERLKELAPP